MPTVKLQSIVLHVDVDTYPDASYLGKYTDKPTAGAIDRQALGDIERGQYRYFVPANTAEETGSPDSPMQDYKRMEALQRGDWQLLGVWAEAILRVTVNGMTQQQRIRSGGLWGIESDSSQEFIRSVQLDELADLRAQLEAFHVDLTDFNDMSLQAKIVRG
jgi:hypothetical protein